MSNGELTGPYDGECMDNQDPEGLQRIRAYIPGIASDGTEWAFPMDRTGGRKWEVPKTRADYLAMNPSQDRPGDCVQVFFSPGEPELVHYAPGHGGKIQVNGATLKEVPSICQSLAPADFTKVYVLMETPSYLVYIDERTDSRGFYVVHKPTGDTLFHDGKKQGWQMKGTLCCVIESDGIVWNKGTMLRMNNRPVEPLGGKTI